MARRMLALIGLALCLAGPAAAQGTLRFALSQDPDVLDTARSGSYGDRIVTNWMCDQLVDVDARLNFVPQLATDWAWAADNLSLTLHLRHDVMFQDGVPFTSADVAANIQRYQIDRLSQRKAELAPVRGVETPDPYTVRFLLSRPYAPLLALLGNRPGTMLSPRIFGRTPDEIIAHPVCTGPYRFVERVAQDHITLEKFAGHWNAKAMGPERVIFLSMVDGTIREVNLQSGAIDIHNSVAPSDVPAVQANPKLAMLTSPAIGFQIITLNLNHGPLSDTPLGKDPRVRAAFEKAIDRRALNEVVYEGRFIPSNQTEAPGSRYWNPALPVPDRDIEGAKALMRQAGVSHLPVTLLMGTDPVGAQVGQVLQSMVAEAGFELKLVAMDGASATAATRSGNFQAAMGIWSGRPDPDGNISIWASCNGFLNSGQYCSKEMDDALAGGAATTDPALRVPFYRKAAEILARDRSHLVLYHFTWLWGINRRVTGLQPMPDGILRPAGVRLLN